MLNSFTLKNGIKVATYSLPQVRSVHIRLSVKSGSVVETPQNNGTAHFLEHMLVQGIPSFPTSEDLSAFVESLAGNYGAYTESSLVGFHITVPSTHIEDALKISSEVFFAPLLMDEPFKKEKQVIINEITQRMDSHFYRITKFLLESRFGLGHPLTLLPGGTIESVKSLTKEDLQSFWKKYFLPENTYMLVIGNFNEKKLKSYLNRYFLPYKNNHKLPTFPKISNADFTGDQVNIRKDDTINTIYLDLTFPSLPLEVSLSERLKQKICLVILGQLRNSRLFKLLRYQKGLVYNVSVGSSSIPGLGYVAVYSEVNPPSLDEVIELIAKEVATFIKHGPTDIELESAKNYLSNQWLMSFDHPSSISSWIEDDLLWEDKILLPEDYISLIKDIKTTDLLETMNKYWDLDKAMLTLQGPIEESKETKDRYKNIINSLK